MAQVASAPIGSTRRDRRAFDQMDGLGVFGPRAKGAVRPPGVVVVAEPVFYCFTHTRSPLSGVPQREYARPVTVEITCATPDRVPDLATLIGRAFSDDPMALWPLHPDAAEEEVRLWFLWFDEMLAPLGMLWEAGRGLGAAAWFPPGEDERFLEIDRAVRPRVASLTDDGAARYAEFWDWIEAHSPDEPHWFLDHVAVAPEQRGKGVGSGLVRFGLDHARADGVPAFLETARPENVGLYEHLGFRVVLDENAPGAGPHIWFMRFDP